MSHAVLFHNISSSSQTVLGGNRLVVSEQRGVKKLQEKEELVWNFCALSTCHNYLNTGLWLKVNKEEFNALNPQVKVSLWL